MKELTARTVGVFTFVYLGVKMKACISWQHRRALTEAHSMDIPDGLQPGPEADAWLLTVVRLSLT